MDSKTRRLRKRSVRQNAKAFQKELNHAKRVVRGLQNPCDYMTLERAHKEVARANERERICKTYSM